MTAIDAVNQLAFVVVSGRQAEEFMQRLSQNRFYFTRIDSSGGILQEATFCLLIGLNQARLPVLLGLAELYCKPYQEYIPAQLNLNSAVPTLHMIEAQAGGALVYVLGVERFEQI
jgi:uncharacterized protein YaaQ